MAKAAQNALWSFTISDGPVIVKNCIDPEMSNGWYPSSWLNVGGRPAGTGHLKDEVEMSEAIFGRSVEEAGLQTVMYKQGCAHYPTSNVLWFQCPHILANTRYFLFFIIVILVYVKWYIIVVWICISLMTKLHWIFSCIYWPLVPFSEKCQFKSFAYF